ncbi:hypothetical protein C6P45_001840 [Maudiozyma exigua]|uniref:FAS1 domain-containing protein n=1 Tax=Maudiozyma exigua TaxID=34358 RepID=A0A9P6VYG7_MAUEX|nr:hypothetical protein C6P45_001840 [Kazachstania exigua]
MRNFTTILIHIITIIPLVKCIDLTTRPISSIKDENDKPTPDFPFTTVIDILSSNVQFSTFLRMIQRSGNVNHLNDLQNFTLFAPVNSAFADYDKNFDISSFDINDYVIHERILHTDNLINNTMIIYTGVKYPFVVGQSWDRMTKAHFKINKIPIVEPNLIPNFQNATVHGILNTLEEPRSLSDVIITQSEILHEEMDITFHNLIGLVNKIPNSDQLSEGNTIMIPSDDSFNKQFNSVEIKYLMDSYNNLDRMQRPVREKWIEHMISLYNNLIFKGIHGGSTNHTEVLKNMNNDIVSFKSNMLGTHHNSNISDTSSLVSNEIFNWGVSHFYEDLSILNNGISFDAENYLHGLNCSGFVSEMYFRGLENMIQIQDGNDDKMTIFVPDANQNDGMGFTKSTLLYHFVNGQLWLEEDFPILSKGESYTKLLESAFCSSEKKLGNNCQRTKITKKDDGYWINGRLKVTLSKPYVIGNKLIYTFSGDLTTPSDLILSVPPFAHCSKSISFLRQLNLLELKPNYEGYTVLLPCYNSWGELSLTMELLERRPEIMEQVMKNFILDKLYYTDLEGHIPDTVNLLGDKVKLDLLDDPTDETNVKLNLNTMLDDITLKKTEDIFFNQGVLQPFQMTDLPKSVNISIKDLIEVTDSTEMINFIENFESITEKLFHHSPNKDIYSILVPTYSSLIFEDININSTKLHDFLDLHILRGNETQGLIDCSDNIITSLGQILECRKLSETESFLKIKGGSDNEVRILKKGCSTWRNSNKNQKACVFLIDRPLSLSWINGYHSHFSFPLIAIATGAVIGVILVMSLFCCVVVVKSGKDPLHRNNNHDDLEQNTTDENDPRRSLLSVDQHNVRNYASQHRMVRTPNSSISAQSHHSVNNTSQLNRIPTNHSKNASQAYSANSTSNPIDVSPPKTH